MSSNENPFNRNFLDLKILNEYNSKDIAIEKINEFKIKLNLWKNDLNKKN